MSGLPNSFSSSSSSISMSRFARPLLRSIGFGRENIDCPDLRAECVSATNQTDQKAADQWQVHSLSHHRRQPDELEHVTCDEQQRIEQLFFFARGAAPGEEYNEDGYRTYQGDDEVQDVERRLPKLLRSQP
jgi:hypothetical protein